MTSQEIKAKVDKQIADFKKTLKPDEIAKSPLEFNPKKHKLIDRECYFQTIPDVKDLGVLEMISGSAYFSDSKVEKLGNLRIIGGSAIFRDSKVENLGNLTTIGGSASFTNGNVVDLGNLTTIGGSASFDDSKVENLGKLTTIGGNASFEDSKIENLGNLTTIGGDDIYANGNKLTRQQVIDHLNKMNQNFFVIRNSLYGIEKEWSDPIVSIKKGTNMLNLVSWEKLPLGKIFLNLDGTFGVQFKMYY